MGPPPLPYATAMQLLYERGEHRRKHCWSNNYAGYTGKGRNRVGKCSSDLTDIQAQNLLNSGIWVDADLRELPERNAYPDYVYNVYGGVPYRAAVTVTMRSMHGYPCLYEKELPAWLRARLRQLAEDSGYLPEFNRWLKNNVKPR